MAKTFQLCSYSKNIGKEGGYDRKSSNNLYPNNQPISNYWAEIKYTSNHFENSILWGTKWSNLPNNTLTYIINQGNVSSINIPGSGDISLINVSQSIRESVDTIMNDLSNIISLNVERVNDVKDAFISINFLDADNNNFDFLGIALPPVNKNDPYYSIDSKYTNVTDSFWTSGNAYIAYKSIYNFSKGSYMYDVILHELGHALGLAHPHDYGGNSTIMAGVTSSFGSFGKYYSNIQPITCMSYNDTNSFILAETIQGENTGYMGTYGPLDIKVLQYMYGLNSVYNIDNTIYTFNNVSNKYWMSIYDSGGIDTIDASSSTSGTNIDIRSSSLENSTKYAGVLFSYNEFGGLTIAKNTIIENVIGSSNDDEITGNNQNNEIDLIGGGNDIVDGKLGFDTAYLTNLQFSDVSYDFDVTTGVITIIYNNNTIRLVNVEKIVFSDKEILIETDVIETGYVSVNHIPKTVLLEKTFNNPVVCCSDPSKYGGDPCTVRITDINQSSFTIYLQEPNNKDGEHVNEKISWIVGEKGIWNQGTENQVIFDSYLSNITTKTGFQKNIFQIPFLKKPIVLSQIASTNGTDYVVTRTKNSTTNSFECSMQEAEGNDNNHTTEKIDWCAFSPGTYTFSGRKIKCGYISNINHRFKRVNIGPYDFKTVNIITRCSSYNGKDTVNTRIIPSIHFDIQLQEETTKDRETNHINETVDYILFE